MFQVKLSLAGSNSENYLPLPDKEPKSHREELCINSGSRLAFPVMDLVVFFFSYVTKQKKYQNKYLDVIMITDIVYLHIYIIQIFSFQVTINHMLFRQ